MDSTESTLIVIDLPEDYQPRRLDVALVEELSSNVQVPEGTVLSRGKVGRLISSGSVRLNGDLVSKLSEKVRGGDQLNICLPKCVETTLTPDSSVAFAVLYEDDDVIVVDKPAGLTVHPGAGNEESTLVHGLLARLGPQFAGIGSDARPGIVHRLDKGTSGAMVVAKSDHAYYHLSKQFIPPRTVQRQYQAFVARLPGKQYVSVRADYADAGPDTLGGVISLPLDRNPNNRTRMAVRDGGREAVTHWQLLEAFSYGNLLQLTLDTGRTHQIRVHLQAVGAPILGDPVYGEGSGNVPGGVRGAVNKITRQALHAVSLSFLHPRSEQRVQYSSSLPDDLVHLHQALRTGP